MLAEIHHNELVIISEDATDVEYLENLFANDMRIIKDFSFIRQGFHVTNMPHVEVTIKKE